MKNNLAIAALYALALCGCMADRSGDSVPRAAEVNFSCVQDSLSVADTVTSACFDITSGVPWNVELTEGSDWIDSFTQSGAGCGKVEVRFSANAESAGERYASFLLWSMQDETRTYTLSLTQRSAVPTPREVTLTFEPSDWTPALAAVNGHTGFLGNYTHSASGYEVEFCCTSDPSATNYEYHGFSAYTISGKPSVRFNTNKPIAGWIGLPCPAGRAIKTLYVFCPNSSQKTFSVYDTVSETAVTGVKMASSASLSGSSVTFGSAGKPWTTAPAKGQTLYLYANQANAGVSEIKIVFE